MIKRQPAAGVFMLQHIRRAADANAGRHVQSAGNAANEDRFPRAEFTREHDQFATAKRPSERGPEGLCLRGGRSFGSEGFDSLHVSILPCFSSAAVLHWT